MQLIYDTTGSRYLQNILCDICNFVLHRNGDLYVTELNAIVEEDYCAFYCAAFRYDGGGSFRSYVGHRRDVRMTTSCVSYETAFVILHAMKYQYNEISLAISEPA